MDVVDIIMLIATLALVALSAFFSSAETAFTTVSDIKMMTLAEDGDKRAKLVLKIKQNSHKMLSAILIGNNIVNLTASSLATMLATKFWDSFGAGIATGILTFLILIFGEISPKTMATIKAERIAARNCKIIWGLMVVLTPIIFIVNKISYGFMRLLGTDANAARKVMTEAEIRTIVGVGAENDVIEEEERDMINNLFDFSDDEVKEVMVPHVDVVMMDVSLTYEEMLAIYRESYYTRYPVCENGTDDVIGVLNMKDVLGYDGLRGDFKIREIMREGFFTYEHKNTYELFQQMKTDRINFAIVLDEYGATAGIITMEDLIEEIVGEIRDEFDSDEHDLIEKIKDSDNSYNVDASINFEDFCEKLELNLKSDVSDTLAGYIMEIYGGVPDESTIVEVPGVLRILILTMDNKRIDKVCVTVIRENADTEDAEEDKE